MAQQQEQQHWHTTFCGGWWVWVSTLFWFLLLRKSHAHSHAPRRAPIALKHGKQLCFCLLICGCISFFLLLRLLAEVEVWGFDFIAGLFTFFGLV